MDSLFGSRIQFSSRAEFKEALGHRRSTVRYPSKLGQTFKAASFFSSVLRFWTESVLKSGLR
jgi:hypothetical protein